MISKIFFVKKRVGLEYSYSKSHQSGEYFPFKTWVIMFRGWLIFSLKWFKPLKTRIKNFNKLKFNLKLNPSSTTLTNFQKLNYSTRFKVMLTLLLRRVSVNYAMSIVFN